MRTLLKRLEAVLAAIAFAEEGDVTTARELLADAGEGQPRAEGRPPRPRGTPTLRAVAPRGKVARSS